MATCIVIEATTSGTAAYARSSSGYLDLPWSMGPATFSGGEYSCPTGTHLLMTVAEVNAMPKTGVPDGVLMKETFFLSFGLVMACYLMGKFSGSILQLIRGDRNRDF